MRFVCSDKYREFRGYVFANGNPVTINDRGTLEAIRCISVFKEVKDEPQKVEAPTQAAVLNPDACPKCGRIVKRGKTMHVKYCKGIP